MASANVFAPYGARLIESEGTQFRCRRYPNLGTNAIWEGDFVILNSAGAVDVAPNASGGPLLGVAIEKKAVSDVVPTVAVIDDPNATFEIQCDNLFAQTSLFLNASFNYLAGSNPLGRSKNSLNTVSLATSATLPLKVIGLSNEIGNAYGSFAKVLVKINNHYFKGGTGTLGV